MTEIFSNLFNHICNMWVSTLDISNQHLTVLPDLSTYTNLKILICFNNQITELNNLPNTLQKLYCSDNQIIELDIIPSTLRVLICPNNPFLLNYDYEISVENIKRYNIDKQNEQGLEPVLK